MTIISHTTPQGPSWSQTAAERLADMTGLHSSEWTAGGSPERLEYLADVLLTMDLVDGDDAREAARLYRIAQGETPVAVSEFVQAVAA